MYVRLLIVLYDGSKLDSVNYQRFFESFEDDNITEKKRLKMIRVANVRKFFFFARKFSGQSLYISNFVRNCCRYCYQQFKRFQVSRHDPIAGSRISISFFFNIFFWFIVMLYVLYNFNCQSFYFFSVTPIK